MEITETQFNEWRNAIANASFGNNLSLKKFKEDYPELYRHMSSMLNKRTKIKTTIKALETVSPNIYWGALTYNEEEDPKDEKTKRKQALRFFTKHFKLFMFVEEYGSDTERYHIHFFGILKERHEDYERIREDWHSFMQITLLHDYEYVKKVKYLTKYAVKSVPRIRMCKRLGELVKDYKKRNSLFDYGFNYYETDYCNHMSDIIDLPF